MLSGACETTFSVALTAKDPTLAQEAAGMAGLGVGMSQEAWEPFEQTTEPRWPQGQGGRAECRQRAFRAGLLEAVWNEHNGWSERSHRCRPGAVYHPEPGRFPQHEGGQACSKP